MYQRKLIMPAVFQLSYYLLLIIHNKPITLLDLTVQQEFTCQLRLPCFSFPTTANLKPNSCILVFDVNWFSWKRLWHSMCWKHIKGNRFLTKHGTDSWQNREQILDKTEHRINTVGTTEYITNSSRKNTIITKSKRMKRWGSYHHETYNQTASSKRCLR